MVDKLEASNYCTKGQSIELAFALCPNIRSTGLIFGHPVEDGRGEYWRKK